MQVGTANTERHNQVAGIVYRNICTEYGPDPPKSRWETPQKVVENNREKGKSPVGFPDAHRQERYWPTNQKEEAVVIDIAVPSDSNKKEY